MYAENRFEGKPSTRKSIRYFNPERGRRAFQPSLYTHMLVEDLHLGVMPIGGRSDNPDFVVKLVPPSEEVAKLVREALPSSLGREPDLTRAVCHFIDEAANIIAYFGKAFYEIVYYFSDNSRENIEGFEFERIMNPSVFSLFGIHMQVVPREIRNHRSDLASPIVVLPRGETLVVSFPGQLGGASRYRKLLSQLQWFGRSVVPDFAAQDMARQKQTSGYDFSVYKRNQSVLLASITKHLGWTARQLFNEESLEFYQIYRILEFHKCKAILREHILNQINRSLHLVGKRIGFKARIEVEGIPQSKDYDEHIEQLLSGELSFSDALKTTRI